MTSEALQKLLTQIRNTADVTKNSVGVTLEQYEAISRAIKRKLWFVRNSVINSNHIMLDDIKITQWEPRK